MSVESAIDKISLDLHKVGLHPIKTDVVTKDKKQKEHVADSWEDESEGEAESPSVTSEQSTGLEAPGPTHLKSPTTRAVDAQREIEGEMNGLPEVPPPTPISPSMMAIKPNWLPSRSFGGNQPLSAVTSSTSTPRSTPPTLSSNPTPRHGTPEPTRDADRDRRRPEKTTATANRLIAGALGIRAPPKTEEQRKYERAVKEQEIRRRNKEKEDKTKEAEEDEKLKAAIWDS